MTSSQEWWQDFFQEGQRKACATLQGELLTLDSNRLIFVARKPPEVNEKRMNSARKI